MANLKISELLYPDALTSQQAITSLQSVDFETFNFFKRRWLKNLAFTWLIEGHLTEESALKMVAITEAAIQFSSMSPDSIP